MQGLCNSEPPKYVAFFKAATQQPIEATNSVIYNTSATQFTASAWVKPTQYGTYGYISRATASGSIGSYLLQLAPGTNNEEKPGFYLTNAGAWYYGNSAIPLNVWSFVVVTFNSGNVIFYIYNGTGIGGSISNTVASASSIQSSACTIAIGLQGGCVAGDGEGTNQFIGAMSNVQLYNSTVSANTIRQLEIEGLGGEPITIQNLIGWWPLNGDTKDYSGNGDSAASNGIIFESGQVNTAGGSTITTVTSTSLTTTSTTSVTTSTSSTTSTTSTTTIGTTTSTTTSTTTTSINPLTATLAASPTSINQGSNTMLTATWSGGTAPYSVNLFTSNAICGNLIQVNSIGSVFGTTWPFIELPATTTNYCAFVQDSEVTPQNTYTNNALVIVNIVTTSSTTSTSTSLSTTSTTLSTTSTSLSTTSTSLSTTSTSTSSSTSTTIGSAQWTATTNYPLSGGVARGWCGQSSGYVYCVAGYDPLSYSGQVSTYYAPVQGDGSLGAWIGTNAYPLPVDYSSCSIYSGYIYCVGGYTSSYQTVSYYAPIFGTGGIGAWTATTSYPTAIAYQSCVPYASGAINNIYCVGGYTGSAFQTHSYYAPMLGSGGLGVWTASGTTTASSEWPACVVGSTAIYCVNGAYSGNKIQSSIIQSSGAFGSWVTSANTYPWMGSYVNPICVTDSTDIYCIAGSNNAGLGINNDYWASIVGSGVVGTWSAPALTSYPANTYFQMCTTYNGNAYCIGGVPTYTSVYYAPLSALG